MINKVLQLERLSCPSCASKIETVVKKMNGVESAEVMFISSKIKVAFDELVVTVDEIKARIAKLGYQVLGEK